MFDMCRSIEKAKAFLFLIDFYWMFVRFEFARIELHILTNSFMFVSNLFIYVYSIDCIKINRRNTILISYIL